MNSLAINGIHELTAAALLLPQRRAPALKDRAEPRRKAKEALVVSPAFQKKASPDAFHTLVRLRQLYCGKLLSFSLAPKPHLGQLPQRLSHALTLLEERMQLSSLREELSLG